MRSTVNTRQRALDVALELASRRGPVAVSMGDIAAALGIKAPSLYKYFKGKEELFGALTAQAEEHYRALWAGVETRLEQMEQGAAQAGHLTAQALETQGAGWFFDSLDDARGQSFRRMAAAGQAGDRALCWDRPVAVYEDLFARLIDAEILRRGDPHVMAVQFLSPLFQLLAQRDLCPERTAEPFRTEAQRHIQQFHRVFAHRENRNQSPASRLFRR